MKKIICLFSLSALLLTSCSGDDDNAAAPVTPDTSGVLLRRTIDSNEVGETLTTIATYNGNKLVSITDDQGGVTAFTYVGDLITQIDFTYDETSTGIDQTNTYAYNSNGQLVTFKRLEPNDDLGHREVYTHNPNGTISVAYFIGDEVEQTTPAGTGTITFLNGEVSEMVTPAGTISYAYDDKNNPSKNVIGLDKISFVDDSATGNQHNITSETGFFGNSSTTYTYNSLGFPITSVETSFGQDVTTQYFYE